MIKELHRLRYNRDTNFFDVESYNVVYENEELYYYERKDSVYLDDIRKKYVEDNLEDYIKGFAYDEYVDFEEEWFIKKPDLEYLNTDLRSRLRKYSMENSLRSLLDSIDKYEKKAKSYRDKYDNLLKEYIDEFDLENKEVIFEKN